jgi:peptidyl-prolyl cis-trans isomerase A (cyclophilin A)
MKDWMRATIIAGSGLLAASGIGAAEQGATANAATQAPAADAPPAAEAPPADIVRVVMHTALGDIVLGLDRGHAPITANNFLRYVDAKRYDGTTVYRAMKLDEEGKYGLVQGGLQGNPKRLFKPIAHESPAATGLSNVDGAISMARGDPGTATSDWFIVIGDLAALDGKPADNDPGYAVFGRVLEGMEVVHALLEQPRDADKGDGVMKGQMIAQPVKVISVRRAD